MDFLKDIELIKEVSEDTIFVRGKECLKIDDFYVNLWRDNDNYINGLQFIKKGDISWIWSTPSEFINKYLNNKVEFIEYSVRTYGEPKLSKPKELKGINKSYSIEYIPKKCKCQVFLNGNDAWVKHTDYFSPRLEIEPEDLGAPLSVLVDKYMDKNSRKSKFVYEDSWGDIVLRNEAWICIKNLLSQKNISNPIDILKDILRQQEKKSRFSLKENELENTDMSRFYEKLILEALK